MESEEIYNLLKNIAQIRGENKLCLRGSTGMNSLLYIDHNHKIKNKLKKSYHGKHRHLLCALTIVDNIIFNSKPYFKGLNGNNHVKNGEQIS